MVAGLSLGEYSALVAAGALILKMRLLWLPNVVHLWKKQLLLGLVKWLRF